MEALVADGMATDLQRSIQGKVDEVKERVVSMNERVRVSDALACSTVSKINNLVEQDTLTRLAAYVEDDSSKETSEGQAQRNIERAWVLSVARQSEELFSSLRVYVCEPQAEQESAIQDVSQAVDDAIEILDKTKERLQNLKANWHSLLEDSDRTSDALLTSKFSKISVAVDVIAFQVAQEQIKLRGLLDVERSSLQKEEAQYASANCDLAYPPYAELRGKIANISVKLDAMSDEQDSLKALQSRMSALSANMKHGGPVSPPRKRKWSWPW